MDQAWQKLTLVHWSFNQLWFTDLNLDSPFTQASNFQIPNNNVQIYGIKLNANCKGMFFYYVKIVSE